MNYKKILKEIGINHFLSKLSNEDSSRIKQQTETNIGYYPLSVIESTFKNVLGSCIKFYVEFSTIHSEK